MLDTVLGSRDINKEVKSLETYISREDRQKTNTNVPESEWKILSRKRVRTQHPTK